MYYYYIYYSILYLKFTDFRYVPLCSSIAGNFLKICKSEICREKINVEYRSSFRRLKFQLCAGKFRKFSHIQFDSLRGDSKSSFASLTPVINIQFLQQINLLDRAEKSVLSLHI